MVIPAERTLVIAVLGLGEAGSAIARDLVRAGATVQGYDPAVTAADGVTGTASEADAAREADLVLSVNDVAMMAPVPGRGLRVPMLASGEAAVRYATLLGPLGADIEVLDGPAGLAATKKLLRSVFYMGRAAAVVEALDAARAAGDEPWLRTHVAAEFAAADAGTLDRIIDGTRRHAVRRGAEMEAAGQMLTELGVPPLIADASRALYDRLASPQSSQSPTPEN